MNEAENKANDADLGVDGIPTIDYNGADYLQEWS